MSNRSQRIRRRGVLLDEPVENPPRCAGCDGACCRSFPSVALSWDEYGRLRAFGAKRLAFTLSGARLLIENGCEYQVGSRCGIYPYRPEVCRRFICVDDDVAPAAAKGRDDAWPSLMPLA
jgi:hypothetical protein